jgi:hypothetical protein
LTAVLSNFLSYLAQKPTGSVTFTLKPGESVVLYLNGAKPNGGFLIKPASGESKYFNYWGMHSGGAGRD